MKGGIMNRPKINYISALILLILTVLNWAITRFGPDWSPDVMSAIFITGTAFYLAQYATEYLVKKKEKT